MKDRFEGAQNRVRLIEALCEQQVLQGDSAVAGQLADAGEIVEFAVGESLIVQDGTDDAVYFLLMGAVDIIVNDRPLARRSKGSLVGEMAAIDPTSLRSATARAATATVALKVSGEALGTTANASPQLWQRLAKLAHDRLRERGRLHRPANEQPILFIGSSVEGLDVAKEIEAALEHSGVVVRKWSGGVFGPSGIPIDELLQQVDQADFAVLVLGSDDQLVSRGREHAAPRDNVVFELGLFIARLGRARVFMVTEADTDVKIPTDLLGVSPITYKLKPGGGLAGALGPASTRLEQIIKKQGVLTNRTN